MKFKFRAWRYGLNIMTDTFSLLTFPQDLCREYEVMQFTGLHDKNGKEIYEGDIINGLVVTYLGDSNAGLGMNAGWYLQRDDFESWVELECRCNENENNYEIIGNIYETRNY